MGLVGIAVVVLLGALEAGAVLALVAVIFVEVFGGRNRLGSLAFGAYNSLDRPRAFAVMLVVWVLGVLVALPFALARWLVGVAR
jgi:ABC-type nitrate/sulfonate/bicarbonate transport system permease component